jgi:aldehyde:ferredoxin oxidoreductase
MFSIYNTKKMKCIRINVGDGFVKTEDVQPKYKKYSARGLVSALVLDEINPTCEPLREGNKIFLSPGFLAGTNVSSANRVSLGTKSPLTMGIKESSSGGNLGLYMGRLGIKIISIEGLPPKDRWYYIYISKDEIKLIDATQLLGLGCYDTTERLIEKHGKKIAVMSIGPAGEKQFLSSCISVTDKEGEPTRQFGRGGVGAVMGSKHIKALVINSENTQNVRPKDIKKAGEFNKIYVKKLMAHPVSGNALPKFGTGVLVNMVSAFGAMPTNAFSQGSFEYAENISGEKMQEIQFKRGGMTGHSCMPGCVIRCSNVYNDKDGKNITGGLEYETLCLLGSNIGIKDLDEVAKLNRLCDDVGIDTIEAGVALGIAIDTGYITLGSFEEAEEVLKGMCKNSNLLSRIIGQGAKVTGIVLGSSRIPHVKGQAMAAYDPRTLKGMGAVYCATPQGADHTAGPSCTSFMKSGEDKHISIAQESIIMTTALENTGLCRFTNYSLSTDDEALEAVLGLIECFCDIKITKDELLDLGKEINEMEMKFNELAGFTKKDNVLPEFMLKEKLKPKEEVFDFKDEDIDKIVNNLKGIREK